jgi:short-subunit dehydrogenase
MHILFILLFLTCTNLKPVDAVVTEGPIKKALVIGASSGMGYEIAKILIKQGYKTAVTARRIKMLTPLKELNPENVITNYMDIANIEESTQTINQIVSTLGGLDLCIIAATGYRQMDWNSQDWKTYEYFLHTDVIAFTALSKTILNYFEEQQSGHLVGFSSVSGYRAEGKTSIYSAAKSYATRFLEGERNRFIQKNIPVFITELVPGWVITSEDPEEPKSYMYWVDSQEDAGDAIWRAIQEKKSIGYITERQEKVVKLIQSIPEDLYNALNARPGGML